jgi:hypothetical protein
MHRSLSVLWIFLARILPPSTRHTSILWRIDNTTALAHVRGRALLEGAERILRAHQRQLRLLPAYIPSEVNVQADAASRFQSIPDWHLAPRVFHQILALRGSFLAYRPRRGASSPGTPRTSHSARGGTSNWLSSSLSFPSSRGLSVSWNCPGGHFPLSPHTGMPRRGLPLFKGYPWKTFAVFRSATTSSI